MALALGSAADGQRKHALFSQGVLTRRPDPERDLIHYLRSNEFRDNIPWKIASRQPDRTGLRVTDRIVSRLEVHNALSRLPARQRRTIELLYVEDLDRPDVLYRLGVSSDTLTREHRSAIRQLVDWIFEWGR